MNKYAVPYTDFVSESGSQMVDPLVKVVYAKDFLEALAEAIRLITIEGTDYDDPKNPYHRAVWHKDDSANEEEEGYVVGNPVLIARDIKYMTISPDEDFRELVEVTQWKTREAAEKLSEYPHVNMVEYHNVHGQPINRYGEDATDGDG